MPTAAKLTGFLLFALIGAAVDGQGGEGQGAVIGGGGGAAVSGIATSEHWQQVYRRAYAECRAG